MTKLLNQHFDHGILQILTDQCQFSRGRYAHQLLFLFEFSVEFSTISKLYQVLSEMLGTFASGLSR